jgi:hypothetical protein
MTTAYHDKKANEQTPASICWYLEDYPCLETVYLGRDCTSKDRNNTKSPDLATGGNAHEQQ